MHDPAPGPGPADILLAQLNAHQSASRALEDWCRRHFPDRAGRLRVALLEDRPLSPDQGRRICPAARPDDRLRYRRVAICWGDLTLSRATNIYYPERLPGTVAAALLSGDRPFGLLLDAFGLGRRTLAITRPETGCLLRIDAEMSLPSARGPRPIAFVRETYLRSLFAI